MYLSILLPRKAEPVHFVIDRKTVRPFEHLEAGLSGGVVAGRDPLREKAEATVVCRWPGAADITPHGGQFNMSFVPQAAARRDRLSFWVTAPPGYEALT